MVISGSISLSGMLTNAIKRGHRVIDYFCVLSTPLLWKQAYEYYMETGAANSGKVFEEDKQIGGGVIIRIHRRHAR